MKTRYFALFLLAVLLLVLGLNVLNRLDPQAQSLARAERYEHEAWAAQFRPFWLWVGRLAIVGLGVALVAGVRALWHVSSLAQHLAERKRQEAREVRPQFGVYPALHPEPAPALTVLGQRVLRLPAPAPAGLDTSLLNPLAQQLRAAMAGSELGPTTPRFPAALARRLEDPVTPDLPELAPPLPERVDIFSAPLPDQPALLLGQGTNGPIWLEMDEGGHVLVGGSPRSGKTNFIGGLIAQAARSSPRGETIQVALSDLKRVDFALMPPDLALLRWPVALTIADALAQVRAVAQEMDRRLTLLAAAHVRTIGDYNRRRGAAREPYLLQIIDEIAEMTTYPDKAVRDEFSHLTQRIGQLGSAAGIMQVLATQRPSKEVITRNITAMCDTRIGLRVAAMAESMLILDVPGAEGLPDVKGRALIRSGGQILEAQTYYSGLRDGRFDDLMSRLPRRTITQLPAAAGPLLLTTDAEADGQGAVDLPDGVWTDPAPHRVQVVAVRPVPVVPPPLKPVSGGYMAVAPAVAPLSAPSGSRVVARQVSREEQMYRFWLAHDENLRAVERQFFKTEGGAAHYEAAQIINAALRQAGRPPKYKDVRQS